MKVLFDQIPLEIHPNYRGGEGEFHVRMFDDGVNKILSAKLTPGSSIGMHTHEINSEVFYILSGHGKVLLADGTYETMGPGDCHYCPQGHAHSLINDGQEDLCIFALVPKGF